MSNMRAARSARKEPEDVPTTSTIKKRPATAMSSTIVCGEEEQPEYDEFAAEDLEDDDYLHDETVDAPIANLAISIPSTTTNVTKPPPKQPSTSTTKPAKANPSQALIDMLADSAKAIRNKVTYDLSNSLRRQSNAYNCDYNIKTGRVPSDLLKITTNRTQPVAPTNLTHDVYEDLRAAEGEILMKAAKAMQILREERHTQAAMVFFNDATATIKKEAVIGYLRNRARKLGTETIPDEMMETTVNEITTSAQQAIDKYHVDLTLERKNVATKAKSYNTRMIRLAEEQAAGMTYATPATIKKDAPSKTMKDFYHSTDGILTKPTKQPRKSSSDRNSPKKQDPQNNAHFDRNTPNNNGPSNQVSYPLHPMQYSNHPYVPQMYPPQNNGYWMPGPFGPPPNQFPQGHNPYMQHVYTTPDQAQNDNTIQAKPASNKKNNK